MSDLFKVQHHKLFTVTCVGMEAATDWAGECTVGLLIQKYGRSSLKQSLTFTLFLILNYYCTVLCLAPLPLR